MKVGRVAIITRGRYAGKKVRQLPLNSLVFWAIGHRRRSAGWEKRWKRRGMDEVFSIMKEESSTADMFYGLAGAQK